MSSKIQFSAKTHFSPVHIKSEVTIYIFHLYATLLCDGHYIIL